ncbi:hypothetical protein Q5752_003389 [Cryptotrichosporon argae]
MFRPAPLPRLISSVARRSHVRAFSIAQAPHARLQPLTAVHPQVPDDVAGVVCLTLDRPDARNALSVQMVEEIRTHLASLPPSTRLLLLHSSSPAFCAGADLRERAAMSPRQVGAFLDSLGAMVCELEAVAVPSVAVVGGAAMGGGLEVALGCDLRIGGPDTSLALPEAKLGIIPGAGGTQRLTRLVGAARAKEIIYTGRRVGGAEAERIGLVNMLAAEPDTPMTAALVLARQILTSAPLSLRAAKAAIDAAPTLPLVEGLAYEREMYETLLPTADRQEGLRAFKEKRRAVFVGK